MARQRNFVDQLPEGSTPFGSGKNHSQAPDGTWYTAPNSFWNRGDQYMERGPEFQPEGRGSFLKKMIPAMAGAIGGAGLIGAFTGGAGAGAAGAGASGSIPPLSSLPVTTGASVPAGGSVLGAIAPKVAGMASGGWMNFLNSPLGQQLLGTGVGLLGDLVGGEEDNGRRQSFADVDDDDPRRALVDPVQSMYNNVRSANLLAQAGMESLQAPAQRRQPTIPGYGGQGTMNLGGPPPTSSGLDLNKLIAELKMQLPPENVGRAPGTGGGPSRIPGPQDPTGGGGSPFERARARRRQP